MKIKLGTTALVSERKLRANRQNWSKWRGVTDAGRQRLREAARRNRPWQQSTGPTSGAGKARSRNNAVRWGLSCTALEPYSSQTSLVKAILAYAHAYAHCILQFETDIDESIPPQVAIGIARAYHDFCDAHGVTYTDDEVENMGVVWLGLELLEKAGADTGRWLGMVSAIVKAEGIRQRAEIAVALRHVRCRRL